MRIPFKLILVIALCLMLSCVTAPGIRTSDVAKLHYGDNEENVVDTLGEGDEVIYFSLEGKHYRYRLYKTIYIDDVYALLFMDGELIAAHNERQDFSECLEINAGPIWEQCLSNILSEMRIQDIGIEDYDFSDGVEAEQEEQSERDKLRGGAIAIAVPLTVVLPGIVPLVCFMACGECDVGARPGDYQDPCFGKLSKTLNQAVNIFSGGIYKESVDNLLVNMQHDNNVYGRTKTENSFQNHSTINYSWSCRDSAIYLNMKLGLTNGIVKWTWFRYGGNTATRDSLKN